jgi:putative membrane protein
MAVTTSASSADRVNPPTPEALTQSHFSWLRTRLSIERTFMSWTRTAVSLIGFGFTIYQFLRSLERAVERPDAPRNFGLAFIGAGVLAMVMGVVQREQEIAYLSGPEYQEFGWREGLPRWRFSNLIAAVVIIIGVVAFSWIILSS